MIEILRESCVETGLQAKMKAEEELEIHCRPSMRWAWTRVGVKSGKMCGLA